MDTIDSTKIGTKSNFPPDLAKKIGTKSNFSPDSATIDSKKIGTKKTSLQMRPQNNLKKNRSQKNFPPDANTIVAKQLGTKTNFLPDAATIVAKKTGTKTIHPARFNRLTNRNENNLPNRSVSTIYFVKSLINEVTMVDEEDDRIKSNKTWIKWSQLNDGTSIKYRNRMFITPEQSEQLK